MTFVRRGAVLLLGTLIVAASLLFPGAAAVAAVPAVERVSGDDRYATSARISATTFAPGVAAAYVAAGDGFADALSGAAAAGTRSSPVLLTRPDTLPAVIAAELTRLRPAEIVVLGGEGAVSPAVAESLARLTAGKVTRLHGADRYDTSAAVSARTFPGGAAIAYVASGETFPDALSAGSVAGGQRGPILLTRGTALPAAVRDELVRLSPTSIVIVGGPGAVSAGVAAQITSATGVSPTRRSGDDRFGTSASISASAFAPGVPVAYVANGMDFPDALSAAAAARGAPLLLTATSSIPPATARELIRLKPGKIVVVGGTGVVSTTTAARLGVVGTDLPAATASRLTSSSEVRAGTCLASPDRTVSLCVSAAGSFSVARGSTVLWSSGTADAAARSLRLRSDGNAILYSVDGRVIWESSTAGTGGTGLSVQNDGDLMLGTAAGQIVWSSMSSAAAPKWRLPYAAGQSWAAGGPHANSGGTAGARGSLDFGPRAGGDRRVLAIADGTVYRVQCASGSYLGINHAGGWQSTYYHLVNYQEQLVGKHVTAGTYLGDVGRTVPCGGGATFDHVHLVIRRAGIPVSVEGMRFGDYTARSSGTDYWGFWTDAAGRRVLTASGGAACCLAAR
jgi:putative cell wall-binding protein